MSAQANRTPVALIRDAAPDGGAGGVVLPPINVSGLVVRKADLIAALKIYVPALRDVTVLDEDRFILAVGGTEQTEE